MFGGIIFLFFTNTANSLLRSEGNAVKAMIAMAVGTFLNIILDPLFIYVFKLGVAGAAIATVISIGVSAILLLYW
jgi:Na+-driven multidrug efflux pump